jgi:signal transduction histidine kinase/DNA-binding response OmpR family regulator/ligand-binding sensor domain-containing protein
VEQGLPNNVVNCSLKDKDGFIWFGTWYGLCRFDGVKFRTYDRMGVNSTVIPPRKIQRIVEDRNGQIWVKTIDRKLYVFNKETETFHAVFDDMKNYSENIQVVKLQKNSEGDILLLTKDKNLLLAQTDSKGTVSMKVLFDSKDDVDPQTYKMRSNKLSETADYICWIGVDYKVLSFKKGEKLASRPVNYLLTKMGLGSASPASVCENGSRMWVGDDHGSFYSVDAASGAVEKYALPELKGTIVNIAFTPLGNVYLSVKGEGLYEYDLKKRRLSKLKISIDESLVTGAYMDRYDKMWFHESEKALVYYDPQSGNSKRFPFTVTGKSCTFSIEDVGERGLFFLTEAGEVWLFDRENMQMVNVNTLKEMSNVQPGQSFLHLFQDAETGSIWLASATQGVYRINFPQKQFRLWMPQASDASADGTPGVRSLCQTRNGDIWMGTRRQKVYLMDRDGRVKHIFAAPKEYVGMVYDIMEDSNGNIWLATKGDGLVKATPDSSQPGGFRFVAYKHSATDNNSISGNDVYSVFQDKHGRIWAGLLDGGLNLMVEENGRTIFKHKNNSFANYPSHGLYMEVRNMVEDGNGRIWVGTMDGLMSFDSNFKTPESIDFEIYHKKNQYSIVDIDVNTMYKDKNSKIWISMFGGGLCRLLDYDSTKHFPNFKQYDVSDGLNSDMVKSMVEDNDYRLWFASDAGLSYYDMSSGRILNFDKYDGFPQVNVEDNAALCTGDGDIWIGCAQGVLSFSPNKIESRAMNYKTFIVGCEVSNKDISMDDPSGIIDKCISYVDGITLKHNQSMFTFEFAALNYNNQNRISYRYILEGYEKEWHYNGRNRIASYTNVPPGKYTFRVETLDEANPDLDSSRSIVVTILPPWWASKFAYTLYVIIAIALLYLGFRFVMFMIKVKNDVYIEQRLSELKIKFFTNISHELRTPLTLIIGPIQELKEKENLSDKGRQYVELMERNINQMLQLVNQLLDFRKIQNGKMRLHVSRFDMVAMVASFEKEFRVLADENEVSFTFQLPAEPIKVWADKDKMAIVIRNILSNAFKFTSQGGNVFVTVSSEENDSKCVIKIEDDGVGIPQSKLTEIFERFAQADNGRNANYRGTGIGLALSKEIVNLHQGKLYAESVEGKGSTFIIEILPGKEHYNTSEVDFYMGEESKAPEKEAVEESVVEEQKSDVKANSSLPTLLIVEDNRDLCNMLKLQLEERFNIYTASDGEEGLKRIHLYHPDIVVTDQMMPKMDGLKMLQTIRADFSISHIPVIVLTAKGDDENKTKAINLGANAYITKPFSRDYLLARIDQLLKERKLFQERLWKSVRPEGAQSEEQSAEKDYEQYLEKRDLQFLEKVHRIVEEHIDDSEFNAETISSTIGLSRSAFFKKLKSLTGFSPTDLIKDIRLNKSMDLIKTTDMTITEIAFAVGFKDSGYFGKCFRKKFNQTPKECVLQWRKSE